MTVKIDTYECSYWFEFGSKNSFGSGGRQIIMRRSVGMKREMRSPGKFLSVILAVILLWMSLPSAQAANYSKVEKSYDIAVVFDNSGSMYNNEAWSAQNMPWKFLRRC